MDVKILSILQKKKKKTFFYFAHSLLQNIYISLSILPSILFKKIFSSLFFVIHHLSLFNPSKTLSLSSFTLLGNSPLPPPLLVEIASPSLPHCHKQRSIRITITNPQFRIHKQRSTSTDPRSTSTVLVDLSTNPQPQVHKNAFSISVDVSMCGCVRFLVDFVVCPFCGGGGRRF